MNSMPKRMDKTQIGKVYEEMAKAYLIDKGYRILAQNFHSRFGEIDLIASQNEYIIFVEVKYRKTKDFGYPREAVTFPKRQKIIKTAQYFIVSQLRYEPACRFDVIEILGDEIVHLENAF